jgi:sensor histidine kinase regulating citrate/malate metabolism
MSFRARLTWFFALIVVFPMIAVGFLVFRLIDESQQAKTDARASGVLGVARVLADSSREVDHLARYGGEELAVILPDTDLEGA